MHTESDGDSSDTVQMYREEGDAAILHSERQVEATRRDGTLKQTDF